MIEYNPTNWFWIVGGDESRAWSSATGAYATEWDAERVTRIANEVELFDVLAKAGLQARAPVRAFTAEEVRDALLTIDADVTGDASDVTALRDVAASIKLSLPPAISASSDP